jgi:hypothetical protein
MSCHKIWSSRNVEKKPLVLIFPAFGDSILGKFHLFPLKVGMMDAVPPPFRFDGRTNAMEHFMIYNIGDKVRGKMRLVEQTVDFDELVPKAVEAKFAMTPGLALSASKPSDL